MESYSLTIQMKAAEHYYPAVLFIMLYKVVLPVESVDEILKCDYSNESYRAVLCYAVFFPILHLARIRGQNLTYLNSRFG